MIRLVAMSCLLLAALPVGALTLAENGKAAASIVLCDAPTPAEQTAAKELAAYLGAVTGGTFTITSESQAAGPPGRIFVGPTKFAKACGVDIDALGPEDWAMRTAGDDLVLVGGRPRGSLYAVYRFLEDAIGVHWWNAYEEAVPRQSSLRVEPLDRKGRPTFRYRDIYMLYANDGGRFAARNRLNRDGDSRISADYGGEMGYGPPYHVHTFYTYVPPDTYFKTHPEWFSLINGQRDASQKQLCLTNAELRNFFVEKLKAYIEQARAAAKEKGEPAPTVFDISQNDWGGMCECAGCQAIAKTEESEAGPLLDFLNYIADAIKKDYPEISLDTLAYMMTQKPPKTIKPRENVIIRLCDTDSNFTKPITDSESAAGRSEAASGNRKFREHLSDWAAIAKNLRIWDYAVTYAPHYGLPLPTVHTYAPDYRFYAEHNVEGVFTEHEYTILADMRDFKIWMMMKLLEDPYQDYQALVRTFTDGFYGAAGEHVRGYLDRLEKAAEAKPAHLSMGASPRQYRFLDLPFVIEAQGAFEKAEKAVAGNEALLKRVRFARLPLDRACLVLFPDLLSQWVKGGHTPDTVPLDRDAIAGRCRDTWYTQITFRIPPDQQDAARAEADAELKPLLARPAFVQLPEKFRGLPPGQVFDYTADVTRNWQDEAKRVPDPEAESGVANRLELSADDLKKYALPMPWGLYDVINKRSGGGGIIKPEDIPGPGYHWYKMGTFPIGPSYYLYFFWSWIIQVDLENAVDPGHPDQPFEIWARIKFEGPGFPRGAAADKNAISVERVVLAGTQRPIAAEAGADAGKSAAGPKEAASEIIDIGDRKQLFIDGLFFESSYNVALHVVPPAKTGERTLVSDRPWENATLNWFSVMDDGKYRMWYECYDVEGWPTADDTSFCYAESADGIRWDKPSLGLFAYHGSSENNILFRQIGPEGTHSRVHGAGVFKDPNAPPESRYKAVSQGMFAGINPPYRVAGMSSPDGLHWARLSRPICDVFADSQYSAFWGEGLGSYVLSGRVSGHGRAIGRSTSPSFEHFDPLALVLQTDEHDPPDSDLYNPAAFVYPYADRVYLMFPSLYRHVADTLDIQLAVSRDGVHWTWPERGKPFVALGAAGTFDSGSLYMGQGMIRVGNELWQYYSGSPLKHNETELDALAKPENRRVYSRVVSRLDGLVSVDAGEAEGGFTTPPLTFRGSTRRRLPTVQPPTLQLNLRTGTAGEVRVGLLDAANKPIAGHAIEDCIPVTGDCIEATVAWKSGALFADIAGKPAKLVVKMKNASLFAFRFVGDPLR